MKPSAQHVTVNGRPRALDGILAHTTALTWLRDLGLTGAKEGCAEGECGACSVLVARPDGDERTQWTAINACLVPAACLEGQEVVTAEGLGSPNGLHPVQQEMAVRGGSQCGYCTPGFVCSMAAEFYRARRSDSAARAPSPVAGAGDNDHAQDGDHDHAPDDDHDPAQDGDHERGPNGFDLHALSGNLCRCTGYRPIRDAAYALGDPHDGDPLAARRDKAPPAAGPTQVVAADGEFIRPATLAEVTDLLAQRPDAILVAGSTDWGVEVNIRGVRAPLTIGIDRLAELRTLDIDEHRIEVGAALSLSEVESRLAGRVPLLAQLFPQFASRLIRNGATIGGNLGTASPIGDTTPVLLALDASVVLASATGEREVALSEFFTGYRTTVKRSGELIRTVRIPLPLSEVTAFHKISKRRFDDISSVAVAYALDVRDGVVARARIGLGGVAATPLRATATEEALTGRPWTGEAVRAAAAMLRAEGTPVDDHRASAAYRAAMLGTSLLKLHAENPRHRQEVGV